MKAYMALSCKVGYFTRVLDELIKLNLSKENVHLLFGPFDILVQIDGLNGWDEFVNKWFVQIKNIMPNEPMIDKTQTFVVISEGRKLTEEPYAFLFLNAQPRNIEQVQEILQKIPQVLSVDTVFGPYDVICAVKAKDTLDLQRLVAEIQQQVPHIQGTMSEIVAALY